MEHPAIRPTAPLRNLVMEFDIADCKKWTTQAGYAQLARLSGHPVLSEVLGRIMRQEGRHIDFYASQAERPRQAGIEGAESCGMTS